MIAKKQPPEFVLVGQVNDFPPGKGKRVEVNGAQVAVFQVDGCFYALRDQCTHAAAPLSSGTVQSTTVRCPRHGAQFDLRTGSVLSLQAVRNVETFAVQVENNEVRVSTEARLADPLWRSGRRLDQGAPDPKSCMNMG